MMIRRIAALAAVVTMALVAGCGIPTEDTPRELPSAGPLRSTAPAPTTVAGPLVEQLCLVRDGKLVRVDRRVTSLPSIEIQLQHLLSGPTQEESDTGLTSALGGTNVIAGVRVEGAEAIVDVTSRLERASRSDEVLAYGQIVCTLLTRPDVRTVSFMEQGQRLSIPRADGSLSGDAPLTVADYEALLDTP